MQPYFSLYWVTGLGAVCTKGQSDFCLKRSWQIAAMVRLLVPVTPVNTDFVWGEKVQSAKPASLAARAKKQPGAAYQQL